NSVDFPTLGRPTMATSALMMCSPAPQGAEDEISGDADAWLETGASLETTGWLDAAGALEASAGTSDEVTTGAAPSASNCWMKICTRLCASRDAIGSLMIDWNVVMAASSRPALYWVRP